MLGKQFSLRGALSALAVTAGLSAAFGTGAARADGMLFWSTQARPVEEAQAVREQVLSGFGAPVDFQPQDNGPFFTRIQAELESGKGTIGMQAPEHGDFSTLVPNMIDLDDVAGTLGDAHISQTFTDLSKLGTDHYKYIPWMQASYVMAANKKALQYLPKGADINALTYDQLIAWAKAMKEATGSPKFGLPAGPKGLLHRFFQGYAYPSFTGSVVTNFRSPEAVVMWDKLKELWAVTQPASTNYGFMQEPLLTGEVWVAWEHTSRLQDAFNKMPDDFVAFPAPAGPHGRGFMPVLTGLAILKTAPDAAEAKKLISYLMKPESQVAMLKATGFFPVTDAKLPDDMPASVRLSGAAIQAQSGAKDAVASLLPQGLGEFGGRFNKVYTDSFQRIVLAGQPVKDVLDDEAKVLKSIMDEAKAPCWAPDKPSEGTCPVN